MLPGISGEELLDRLNKIPTIIISAKVDLDNKVNLLLNGAVDYLTKPFEIKELLARIVVHLREKRTLEEESILKFEEILLDDNKKAVYINNNLVKLTRTEYAILKLLMKNPKQVMTKSNILDELSVDTPDCVESSLKVHISNLRKKIKAFIEKDYIESVWGIGFEMRED